MPVPLVAGGLWVSMQVWAFTVLPALAVKILIGLGIGFVTYSGGDLLVAQAETYVLTQFSGMPVKVYQVLKIAGIDQGVKMIFAAATAYITIRTTMGAYAMFRPNPGVLRA